MTSIDTDMVWPPPSGPLERIELKRVVQSGEPPRVRCRLVRLWGRDVWVELEESARVWCPSCKQLVDVEELGRVDNAHAAISLPHREGQVLPMGADRPEREREPWELGW